MQDDVRNPEKSTAKTTRAPGTRKLPAISTMSEPVPAIKPARRDTAKRAAISGASADLVQVDSEAEDTRLMPHRPERTTSHARQLTVRDTMTVQKATMLLNAVQVEDDKALMVLEPVTADLTPSEVVKPVTVVPAGRIPAKLGRLVPKRKGHPLAMAAVWVASLSLIVAVLSAVSPVAGHVLDSVFVPRGAQVTQNSAMPTGPWSSTSGAAMILGVGGGAGPGVTAPGTAGLAIVRKSVAPAPVYSGVPTSTGGISPAPVSPWPPSDPFMFVPGHYSFAVSPNGYYSVAFGQCTWWAQYKRQDENLTSMGNALDWASSAAARGLRVGTVPAVGATVVFQPGVQGASGAGHVAHVEAVYPDGWFLVSEMNFYWNGGGWGRVDYRFAHTGWGVAFIY